MSRVGWDPGALAGTGGRDAADRVAVVTGANAGVGYFIAEQLATAGVRVILACRNSERADRAQASVTQRVPGARVQTLPLDTSDLDSVAAAAERLTRERRVDLLIANAGSTSPPRQREADARGNELTLSTNVIGHFALVAQLFPLMAERPGARVVTLGSLATKLSTLQLTDLQLTTGYSAWRAYAQSKIVMQAFGFELARRLRSASCELASVVAHPGWSVDGLAPRIPGITDRTRSELLADRVQGAVAQGKDRGAWPVVRAALDPGVLNGAYIGPAGWTRGRPVVTTPTHTSSSESIGARVWQELETYSGVRFEVRDSR